MFVTQIICFVIDILDKVNKKFKNPISHDLAAWGRHFKEKLEFKTNLLYLIYEKYKNMFGFSDEIKYDSSGQIVSKNNYPEIKLAWFMTQDFLIYHFRNKNQTFRESYNKIEIQTSLVDKNDLSTIQQK